MHIYSLISAFAPDPPSVKLSTPPKGRQSNSPEKIVNSKSSDISNGLVQTTESQTLTNNVKTSLTIKSETKSSYCVTTEKTSSKSLKVDSSNSLKVESKTDLVTPKKDTSSGAIPRSTSK